MASGKREARTTPVKAKKAPGKAAARTRATASGRKPSAAAKSTPAKRAPAATPAAKRGAAAKAPAKRAAVARTATKARGAAAPRVAKAAPRRATAGKVAPGRPSARDVRAVRSRKLKTHPTDASVLAFLERVADPARRADCLALNALLSEVTDAPPRMWGASIVGFGQYRYRYSSGHEGDWPVCGYSPRKQDLTVYVMAGFERFPAIMARLGRYKTGKSCLYLRALADIDTAVLRELVAASNAQLARMYG